MVSRVCHGVRRRKGNGRGHEGYGQYQSRYDPANRHRRVYKASHRGKVKSGAGVCRTGRGVFNSVSAPPVMVVPRPRMVEMEMAMHVPQCTMVGTVLRPAPKAFGMRTRMGSARKVVKLPMASMISGVAVVVVLVRGCRRGGKRQQNCRNEHKCGFHGGLPAEEARGSRLLPGAHLITCTLNGGGSRCSSAV